MLENLGLNNWKMKFDDAIETAQNNLAYVGAAVGLLLLLGAGFYWYRTSSLKNEQAAHTILVDCLSQLEQAGQGKAQFEDVVTMAQAGYEKFKGTSVAPYILSVSVDALLAQDKKQEAIEKLDLMLLRIGNNSPLYSLYKLKQVLIKLDMPDLKDAALADLQKLASASSNFTDAAQYYLGLYYQSSGDSQKALEVWKPSVALNESVTDAMGRSPWATMEKLK